MRQADKCSLSVCDSWSGPSGMSLTQIGDASIRDVEEVYMMEIRTESSPTTGKKFFSAAYKTTWKVTMETHLHTICAGMFDTEDAAENFLVAASRVVGLVKLTNFFAVRAANVVVVRIVGESEENRRVQVLMNVKGKHLGYKITKPAPYSTSAKLARMITSILVAGPDSGESAAKECGPESCEAAAPSLLGEGVTPGGPSE